MTQLDYSRAELLLSDHRPVVSLFKVVTNLIDSVKRDAIQKELLGRYSREASPTRDIGGSGSTGSKQLTKREDDILIDLSDPAIPPMGKLLFDNW